MNRGFNERAFLGRLGLPEWCGESEAREALYGFLLGLSGDDAAVEPVASPVSEFEPGPVVGAAPEVKRAEKGSSGPRKGKPGRKRKAK